MLRYLVLLLLIYLVFKYFKYLSRLLGFSGAGKGLRNDHSSDLHVEYDPNSDKKNFTAGEYIEYEEVEE